VVVEVLVEVVVLASPVFCLLAQTFTGFTKSSSPDSETSSLFLSVFGWLRKYCCCAFFASISALRCAYSKGAYLKGVKKSARRIRRVSEDKKIARRVSKEYKRVSEEC
jgi:hypothetical protein